MWEVVSELLQRCLRSCVQAANEFRLQKLGLDLSHENQERLACLSRDVALASSRKLRYKLSTIWLERTPV